MNRYIRMKTDTFETINVRHFLKFRSRWKPFGGSRDILKLVDWSNISDAQCKKNGPTSKLISFAVELVIQRIEETRTVLNLKLMDALTAPLTIHTFAQIKHVSTLKTLKPLSRWKKKQIDRKYSHWWKTIASVDWKFRRYIQTEINIRK